MILHHVGLVVESHRLAEDLARTFFRDRPPLTWEHVSAFECDCAFSETQMMIELVVPWAGSRLERYLGGKSALHHIAFQIRGDEDKNYPSEAYLFPEFQPGARRLMVNFLKPQFGVLVELVRV